MEPDEFFADTIEFIIILCNLPFIAVLLADAMAAEHSPARFARVG